MDRSDKDDTAWHDLLTEGKAPGALRRKAFWFRRFSRHLPADPRCQICFAPFSGWGAGFMRTVLGRRPSSFSMQLCNRCEFYARGEKVGAEVDVTLLFADIRGSTSIAERLGAAEYSRLIDRFYRASTEVLVDHSAIIEKLGGDEVVAIFAPGLAGPDHAHIAVAAAQDLLRATGHGQAGGPWVPVGVGVHRDTVFVGVVGSREGMSELTVLGDAANVTSRLASAAGAGEVLVSRNTLTDSSVGSDVELRQLQLKGREEPVEVAVVTVGGG